MAHSNSSGGRSINLVKKTFSKTVAYSFSLLTATGGFCSELRASFTVVYIHIDEHLEVKDIEVKTSDSIMHGRQLYFKLFFMC